MLKTLKDYSKNLLTQLFIFKIINEAIAKILKDKNNIKYILIPVILIKITLSVIFLPYPVIATIASAFLFIWLDINIIKIFMQIGINNIKKFQWHKLDKYNLITSFLIITIVFNIFLLISIIIGYCSLVIDKIISSGINYQSLAINIAVIFSLSATITIFCKVIYSIPINIIYDKTIYNSVRVAWKRSNLKCVYHTFILAVFFYCTLDMANILNSILTYYSNNFIINNVIYILLSSINSFFYAIYACATGILFNIYCKNSVK